MTTLAADPPATPGKPPEKPPPVAHAIRACTVYMEPIVGSGRACQVKAGVPLSFAQAAPGGFVQIESGDCAGYVSDACVSMPEVVRRDGVPQPSTSRLYRLRVGVTGGLAGTLGTVAGSSDVSKGDGWSLGLRVDVALSQKTYLTVIPAYQVMGLGRNVNLSGQILDPSGTTFTQTIKFISLSVLGGLMIHRTIARDEPTADPELRLEAGFQYLKSIGQATQTSSAGVNITFTPPDDPILFVLGPAVEVSFNRGFGILGYVHLFYNVRAQDSKLFGADAQVALNFGF